MIKLAGKYMKRSYKSVIRSIGYCLALGERDRWLELPIILTARLEPEERAALAYAALQSLNPDHRLLVYKAVDDIEIPAGGPMPPFDEQIEYDAQFWASIATQAERRAYLIAILKHMSDDDKKIIANKLNRIK